MLTSVMKSRQSALRGEDGALLEELPHTVLQLVAAVSPSPWGVLPMRAVWGGERKFPPSPGLQIVIDLLGDVLVERKQARLVELRLANQQGRLPTIVIAQSQARQLCAPNSGGEQQY